MRETREREAVKKELEVCDRVSRAGSLVGVWTYLKEQRQWQAILERRVGKEALEEGRTTRRREVIAQAGIERCRQILPCGPRRRLQSEQ